MQIVPQQNKPQTEAIVPMINVVFLLLVFFLMTAQIAPPEPFQVILPSAPVEEMADGEATLYLSAEGIVAFRDARGEEALTQAVAALGGNDTPLQLRADAGVEGGRVATLLRDLAAAGTKNVTLVTVTP